ncbi:hypothetical protein [Bradyrhizobium paxllaeri]|uniref:hypothetical protein n=1 Tax=Bradyrhizobium paxllaeri TaxID=190148 RepID=UPI001FE6E78D|nr:hypothetical protein [Bradyrhizobium paxllaeri]
MNAPSYRTQIFSHLTDSIDRGQRKRPLGLLSNLVADQLPHCIAEIKRCKRPDEGVRDLGRSINGMIASADYEVQLLNLPQPELAIAKTDIHYLVNCAYQMSAFVGLHPVEAELTIGEELARLSCDRKPSIEVLSYEDMILQTRCRAIHAYIASARPGSKSEIFAWVTNSSRAIYS